MSTRWTAAVSLSAVVCAHADTVNLDYMGQGNGRVVHVVLGSQQRDVFAGRLIHDAEGGTGTLAGVRGPIITFCVDLLESRSPTATPYSSSSIATLSGNTGLTNLGFAKQQAIADLYTAAAERQFTLGLDYATAFQVALWEVVYDYNASLPNHGLDVGSGNFRATMPGQAGLSVSITEKVAYLLGSVGAAHGTQPHLAGLKSPGYQDQLFDFAPGPVVPLPRAGWLGAAGLGILGLLRGVRRR